jgi:hypothetical protein
MTFFKKLIRKLIKSKEEIEIINEQDRINSEHMKACNILRSNFFNNEGDETLDEIISDLLEKEIVSIDNINEYYILIVTSDGFEYKLWNNNKYYGWLTRGSITVNNENLVSWDDAQPSAITMAKLKQLVDPLITTPPPPSKIKISDKYHDLVTKQKNMSTLINKL